MKALYLDEKLEKYYKKRLKPFVKGKAIRPLYEKKEPTEYDKEPVLSEFEMLSLDIFTVANSNLPGDEYVTKDMVYQFILRLTQEIEEEGEIESEKNYVTVANVINKCREFFKFKLHKNALCKRS